MEAFLEDINNLLNAGEVPNIFPVDEKQEICEKMRQIERYTSLLWKSYKNSEHSSKIFKLAECLLKLFDKLVGVGFLLFWVNTISVFFV